MYIKIKRLDKDELLLKCNVTFIFARFYLLVNNVLFELI